MKLRSEIWTYLLSGEETEVIPSNGSTNKFEKLLLCCNFSFLIKFQEHIKFVNCFPESDVLIKNKSDPKYIRLRVQL